MQSWLTLTAYYSFNCMLIVIKIKVNQFPYFGVCFVELFEPMKFLSKIKGDFATSLIRRGTNHGKY